MFRCCSLETSHPRLLPQSLKDCSINLCLFFCSAYRVIINIVCAFLRLVDKLVWTAPNPSRIIYWWSISAGYEAWWRRCLWIREEILAYPVMTPLWKVLSHSLIWSYYSGGKIPYFNHLKCYSFLWTFQVYWESCWEWPFVILIT